MTCEEAGGADVAADSRKIVAATFMAALAPMVTVPALRPLIIEAHGGSPASLHAFVALGMLGGAVGAPLVARRAETAGGVALLALRLCLLDAAVEGLSSCAIPTALLYALRPVHGAASMGLLAILFARFRRSGGARLSNGAAAAILALAFGPAVGGILARGGATAPFLTASILNLSLAPLLRSAHASLGAGAGVVRERRAPITELFATLRAPLAVLATQRLAIGGLVAAWALLARETFHLTDARIGASFSVFLLAFAVVTLAGGRSLAERPRLIACGGLTLATALASLAIAPQFLAFPVLFLGGVGAALAYAPSLDLIRRLSNDRTRVSAMALAHAAGAVGMLLGPFMGIAFDRIFQALDPSTRAAGFLAVVGTVHATASVALTTRLRPSEATRPPHPSRTEETSETT